MRKLSIVLALLATLVPATAQADGTCAPAEHAGGDWPSYGHDLANTRSQPDETTIGPSEATSLAPAWIFEADDGTFNSTPVIANGCMYIGSSSGALVALDADEGDLVWRTDMPAHTPGPTGGVIVGSVAFAVGKIVALVNQGTEPYAAALDADTGDILWQTSVESGFTTYANASTVIYDGLVFFAISGPDAGDDYDPAVRQRFHILDLATGAIVKQTYIIPEREWEHGHTGGAIWATAAVDEATGYAFVGTANPVGKTKEHRFDNAILKIDLDRARPTFGEIVDAYKGQPDNYVPGFYAQPACQNLGDDPRFWYSGGYSVPCGQLDVDFGASPNLWTDAEGNTIVGELQKSGVFHAVYADTMQPVWTAVVAPPMLLGNAGTSAVDGANVFAGVNVAGMVALRRETGLPSWLSPTADGARYQAVSVANGVVYTVDTKGFFDAYDAATGLPLVHRPIQQDTGSSAIALGSSGVAIARNTVYAAAAAFVVAYRVA